MSERLYAVLAAQVGWPVPPMSERIAGIRFVRDGEDWGPRSGRRCAALERGVKPYRRSEHAAR